MNCVCTALWGTTEFIDENALQVNLTRLKKTMTGLGMPQKITPVRGIGYRLENEAGTERDLRGKFGQENSFGNEEELR